MMAYLHESHFINMRRVGLKLAIMTAVLIGSSLLPMPLELKGIAGYEPLHTFFETVTIVVAGLIFAVIWNAPHVKLPWKRMFLALVRQAGLAGYLTKPLEMEVLVRQINALVKA